MKFQKKFSENCIEKKYFSHNTIPPTPSPSGSIDPRSTDQVYGTFVVAAMSLGVLGPASVRLENETVKMRKRLTKFG